MTRDFSSRSCRVNIKALFLSLGLYCIIFGSGGWKRGRRGRGEREEEWEGRRQVVQLKPGIINVRAVVKVLHRSVRPCLGVSPDMCSPVTRHGSRDTRRNTHSCWQTCQTDCFSFLCYNYNWNEWPLVLQGHRSGWSRPQLIGVHTHDHRPLKYSFSLMLQVSGSGRNQRVRWEPPQTWVEHVNSNQDLLTVRQQHDPLHTLSQHKTLFLLSNYCYQWDWNETYITCLLLSCGRSFWRHFVIPAHFT